VIKSPHRRFNALTGDWVLTSAGRTSRPWLGSEESTTPVARPRFDPDCYLCPGNGRASGAINRDYVGTFVFPNDFAALRPDTKPEHFEEGLLLAESEPGTCRVICYSERHDLDLASMPPRDIRRVVNLWADQYVDLSAEYRWVQIFENRGAAAGASNPHPHGQIWAGAALPVEAEKEDTTQRRYYDKNRSHLLIDYVAQERNQERMVLDRVTWVALVPFWAVWPFETLLVPVTPTRTLENLDERSRDDLAMLLGDLLSAYDKVFDHPFPYSMGWHNAPSPASNYPHWQLHAHFYPPLLRSAAVRKFMVGYELLAEAQRDLTAEEVAARLRSLVPGPSYA